MSGPVAAALPILKLAPNYISALKQLLDIVHDPSAGKILNVVTQGAAGSTVSASVTSPSGLIHAARQGMLPKLGLISEILSGEYPDEQCQILKHIMASLENGESITFEHKQALETLLIGVFNNHEPIPQEEYELKNSVNTALNSTTSQIVSILTRTIKSGGFVGMAMEACGMNIDGDVKKYLHETVFTPKFRNALLQSVQGSKDVDTSSFTDIQKNCFRVTDWSIWGAQYLPTWSVKWLPRLNNISKMFLGPIVGRISRIPILGWLVGPLMLGIESIGQNAEEYQKILEEIQRCKKQGIVEVPAKSPAKPTPVLGLAGGT